MAPSDPRCSASSIASRSPERTARSIVASSHASPASDPGESEAAPLASFQARTPPRRGRRARSAAGSRRALALGTPGEVRRVADRGDPGPRRPLRSRPRRMMERRRGREASTPRRVTDPASTARRERDERESGEQRVSRKDGRNPRVTAISIVATSSSRSARTDASVAAPCPLNGADRSVGSPPRGLGRGRRGCRARAGSSWSQGSGRRRRPPSRSASRPQRPPQVAGQDRRDDR